MKLLIIIGFLIFTAIAASAADELREELFEARVYKDAEGKTLPYRLLKPKDYDPKRKYPLVLFLHGAGERGDDNKAQLIHGTKVFASEENRSKYPCFLIAPQCPKERKWSDIDWKKLIHPTPEKPSEPMRMALAAIEELQNEFKIDSKRLYVTGLSMGGFGTWDILARHPRLFAAAVPICGGGDEAKAPLMTKTPIWVFHGSDDTAVKVDCSRNMVEAIKNAGGKPKYSEYPKVGHDSWTQAYNDPELLKWLFKQKR